MINQICYHTPTLYNRMPPGMRDGVQTYSLPSAPVHLVARGHLCSLDHPEVPKATIRETEVGLQPIQQSNICQNI